MIFFWSPQQGMLDCYWIEFILFTSTPIKLFYPKHLVNFLFIVYPFNKPSWYKCSSWLFVDTKHVFKWRGPNLPISRPVIGHLPWILLFHWLLVVLKPKDIREDGCSAGHCGYTTFIIVFIQYLKFYSSHLWDVWWA